MFEQLKSYASAHPEQIAMLVGAILTAILKPRTPEQYAAMPHRLAALLKLLGAIFPDAAKAQQALLALIFGSALEATFVKKTPDHKDPNEPHDTDPPPPAVAAAPPRGPSLLAAALAVVLLALGCGGPGAQSPARDYARAGLSLVAEGQKEADHMCAQLAQARLDAKLAKTCADAYDTGRASLLAGQAVIDTWDSAQQQQVLCAAGSGAAALKQMADAITSAGGPSMPPLVQDALSLGSQLAAGCKDGAAP